MLFHEKLALIKEIISVTGTALAREAGLAPSCVCRYLSAKNSPFRGGGAVTRLSRAAAAVGINGIFMEVHPNPEKALSDGPNSLDFASAEKVLDQVLAIYELTRKMR